MNLERGDVHFDRLGNFEREAFDLDLALERREDAAVGDTGRAPDETKRHRDAQWFGQIDFIEVRVEDIAPDRRLLDCLQDNVFVVEFGRFRFEPHDTLARRGRNPRFKLRAANCDRDGRSVIAINDGGHASLAANTIDQPLGPGGSFFTCQIYGFH